MSSIYALARLTIAADWSPNTDSGIFNRVDKRRLAHSSPYISVRNKNLHDAKESTLILQTEYLGMADTPLSIDVGAVQKRGWCYQERALSPCILHYTATQIIWECRQHYQYQAHPEWNWRFTSLAPLPGIFCWRGPRDNRREALKLWYEVIIPEFSGRAITFQSDKLPAIAGLAHIAAGFIGGDYIAGLWVDELPFGLAWNRAEKGKICDNTCPSWSWARMGGKVMWPLRRHTIIDQPLATIIEARVDLVSADPFGAVSGGIVRLSGRIAGPMFISQNDTFSDLTGIGLRTSLERHLLNANGERLGIAITDDDTFDGEVSCLALWDQRRNQMTHVLLLVRCAVDDEVKNEDADGVDAELVYQRVGVGDIEYGKIEAWDTFPMQDITIV